MDMLNSLLEKKRVAQDKDIESRDGTQPKKYYAKDAEGDDMAKSTKQARARHFEKGTKKDDDDPSAYEPAPGDKSAKTKPSAHTKKFKKMFGEGAAEAAALKAKQADEIESLKNKHEQEVDALKDRHDRENFRQAQDDKKEQEDDAIRKQRDAERKTAEKKRDAEKVKEEVEEGKYVASRNEIIDSVLKMVKKRLEKEMDKNPEKGLGMLNTVGSMVGAKATDKSQSKNKLFLKFGDNNE